MRYKGKRGVITGASGPHVRVLLDGDKNDFPYHPSDLDYTENKINIKENKKNEK